MRWLSPAKLFPIVSFTAWMGACALSTHGRLTSSDTGGQAGHSGTGGAASSSSSTGTGGAGGTTSSSSSTSSSGGCATGTKLCDAACVAVDDPMFGCGSAACDPCTNAHGTTACTAGLCAPACDPGFGDCDADPANGCETDLATTTNCGACGVACTNAHGSTACTGGTCTPVCDAGFLDCNGDANDGCEADLATPATCGACGVACTNAHGSTTCSGGKCTPVCDTGYADCNGDANDGCETATDTDVFNCGACKRACSTNNVAALACSGGRCTSTCILGSANCNQPTGGNDDGCEKNVAGDDNNCGGCGNSCKNGSFNANPACDQGSATQKVCGCTTANECKWGTGTNPSCASGLCTCGNTTCQPGEGCKQNAGVDVCTCYGGGACAAGHSCCQSPLGCFDLQSDPANCGACGHACAPGFACLGGVCSCAANDANCGAGAPAGTFACPSIMGPDKCVCNSGAMTCSNGQRCLANNTCG